MENVINLSKVNFAFNSIPVLQDISLQVKSREFLGIIGPNAGGKSTLLKVMLGLIEPQSGEVSVMGQEPELGRLEIGYVPQYPTFSRDFPINVQELVLMGRLGETRWYGQYTRGDVEIAREAMEVVEITNIANRHVGSLSGGQLQRALIARALATKPEILLLDEPTANIDIQVEENIFGLLKQYNKNMTIIVVSHDIAFISGYVERVACLNQTLVCHTTEEITGKTIEELYGTPVKMIQHVH